MLFEKLPLLFEEVLDLELVVELVEFQWVDLRPESAAQRSNTKHRPILGSFRRQAAAQGVVDNLIERHTKPLRPLLNRISEVVVNSESDSHEDITASMKRGVKVFAQVGSDYDGDGVPRDVPGADG